MASYSDPGSSADSASASASPMSTRYSAAIESNSENLRKLGWSEEVIAYIEDYHTKMYYYTREWDEMDESHELPLFPIPSLQKYNEQYNFTPQTILECLPTDLDPDEYTEQVGPEQLITLTPGTIIMCKPSLIDEEMIHFILFDYVFQQYFHGIRSEYDDLYITPMNI